MKRNLLLFLFCIISSATFAQADTITTAQAKDYIGKEVVLKGKLMGMKPYRDKNDQEIMFLDIDDHFPNTTIGVTVFSDALPELKLSAADKNKTIYIQGILSTYRNKPSLEVNKASQITKGQ